MEKIVLDTYALLAFFFGEKNSDKVEKIIKSARKKNTVLLMSAVNFGELFYAVMKKTNPENAFRAVDMADLIPVLVEGANRDMCLLAGSYKAEKKMSYADCFAAALAKVHGAPLVTGDKEFREIEGEVEIIWI